MEALPAVPRLWPGSTVVCIGSGPSLTPEDVEACRRAGVVVIAVNDAYRLAPWANLIYASDVQWWDWHTQTVLNLPGQKYGMQMEIGPKYPTQVTVLQRSGQAGIDFRPTHLRSGGHSGYAAMNLAVHCGPKTIVLLGYDLQPDATGRHHFFGDHPNGSHLLYEERRAVYTEAYRVLTANGVTVLNASRSSQVPTIPRIALSAVLDQWSVLAQ